MTPEIPKPNTNSPVPPEIGIIQFLATAQAQHDIDGTAPAIQTRELMKQLIGDDPKTQEIFLTAYTEAIRNIPSKP